MTNVKRILISKHREEEVIDHILQGDGKLTNRKEEGMKGRAPMVYQVSKALGVSKTFKIPGNCHCFQDSDTLQTTNKFPIEKFPVHLDRPTGDFPKNEVKENRNCLSRSSPNLEI